MKLLLVLNAFIPRTLYNTANEEVTQYSKLLALSPQGDTSLLPWITAFPSLCFLFASYTTDNRGFSDDPQASARIKTTIEIDTLKKKVEVLRRSEPTHQVRGFIMDLLSCDEKKKVMKIDNFPKGQECVEQEKNKMHISFSASLANPFFALCGSVLAPPVKEEFDLYLDFENPEHIKAHLYGRMTCFPAFEAYLKVEDHKPICLFQYHPEPGTTPFHLFYGWQSVDVKKTISTQAEIKEESREPGVKVANANDEKKRHPLRLAS